MKRKVFIALLAALLAVMIAGCNRNTGSQTSTQTGVNTSGTGSAANLGIKYARLNFNIDYLGNGVKLVTDSGGNRLLLVPRGAAAPQGYDDAVLVETPLRRAMYTVTTHVGYLGALEDDSLYDTVAVVTTPEEDWTTPEVIQRFRSGVTQYVEHGYMNVGNIEDIVALRPEFVFTENTDDSDMRLRDMLDEFGIKHASLQGRDDGINATLEWIKFIAAFYNLDEKADRIFEAKLARLDELYAMTANIQVKTTVGYGLVWSGTVYTQAGTSTLAQQIEKAGGAYALNDLGGSGSVTITMEEFLNRCRNTDVLIYGSLPQYCPDKAYLLETEPLMAEFDAFKNDRLYIFDKGYYMNSAKVVERFEDMVFMFYPNLLPGHQLVMYQKLP